MNLVTVVWWSVFALCAVGLVRSRARRRDTGSSATASAEGADESSADGILGREAQVGDGPGAAAIEAPVPGSLRRRTFSDFDREILAPLLRADLGPDGVRCPGCIDGSVRRYLRRSPVSPDEIRGDVWCASCRRHTTLVAPGDDIDFEDPLAHLSDARRDAVARDLDDYLGGLDLLWTQGALPQQLRRVGPASP